MSEERSIRNVTVPNRMRPITSRETIPPPPPRGPSKHRSHVWLWAVALVALVAIGVGAAVSMRKTTVTVVPRAQSISFDQTYAFTAYPETNAASDTLPYLVQTFDFEDSELVPSTGGTPQVDHPASGSVTVTNAFSASPVKLIKNTRFETADHLIFRTPADVTVPGKKGSTPGTVTITIVADAPGSRYNIDPQARFTIPGLKSNPQMFGSVYASSQTAMTGGSAASESGIDPAALAKAITTIRSRLQAKASESIAALASTSVAFPELAQITYSDEPSVPNGANIQVKEAIHVELPVFDSNVFAQSVAKAASIDTQESRVYLASLSGVTAAPGMASSTLGSTPITFTLSGKSQVVWQIDTQALAQALLKKDRDAFQTIVNGFPGIQESQAQIQPFWSRTFPAQSKDIDIIVVPPKQAS